MKRDYLSRLSLWARWYLPAKEAEEVLEDYRELIEQEPRNEEELKKDIENPQGAVRCLVQPDVYRRWLTVFGILAACVLVPALMTLQPVFWAPITDFIRYACLISGIGISLLWFRREGRRKKRLSKAIPFLLAVALIGMVWAWFLAWAVISECWTVIEFFFPPERSALRNMYRGELIQQSLLGSAIVMIAVSLFGLVKARLGDRRWLAVYLFALTGSLLVLSVYGILSMMSFSPGWQITAALRLAFLTVVGLAGTAVSLC